MPIPELNEHGLLPAGVHDCTLEEIGARFGRFHQTDRRVQLFAKLCALVEEEQRAGMATAMIVDGSFVTDKVEPGDIDLVIVLAADYNAPIELPPLQYNAISRFWLRRRYQFDAFVLRDQTPDYFEKVNFFQNHKDSPLRKGILRVQL